MLSLGEKSLEEEPQKCRERKITSEPGRGDWQTGFAELEKFGGA
jgi:hypothetical protein